METDPQELRREIDQLRKDLDRVSERATRREEDFGAVRAKADRVEALEATVRALARDVERLSGRPAGGATPDALGQSTGAGRVGPPAASDASTDVLAAAVADRLTVSGLLARAVREAMRQGTAAPTAPPGAGAPPQKSYGTVKASPTEDRLVDVLRERLKGDIDPNALVAAATDRLIQQLDLKALTQRVTEALVQRIEVTTRPAPPPPPRRS